METAGKENVIRLTHANHNLSPFTLPSLSALSRKGAVLLKGLAHTGNSSRRVLLLHPLHKLPQDTTNQLVGGGRKTERDDYDIALLRLDYPIMDEGTGATVLPGNKFAKNTLMPICLPPNKGYVGAKN